VRIKALNQTRHPPLSSGEAATASGEATDKTTGTGIHPPIATVFHLYLQHPKSTFFLIFSDNLLPHKNPRFFKTQNQGSKQFQSAKKV
jgi:hypothetical protein